MTGKDKYDASHKDLLSYFRNKGYSCVKVGHEYRVKDIGNSFYINPEKNCFNWFSKEIGGGPIQALEAAFNMTEEQAVSELLQENTHTYVPKKEEKTVNTTFSAPEKSNGYKQLYSYLIKTRGISPETVKKLIKIGILYPTNNNGAENAVFLHLDIKNKPCGADIVGLNSSVRFKKCLKPTESDIGFILRRGKPEKVYLFESPIDMLSFMDIHKNANDAIFCAMGGLKHGIADKFISKGVSIISCVDNDEAGTEFNNRYAEYKCFSVNNECRQANVKDFNELLLSKAEKGVEL